MAKELGVEERHGRIGESRTEELLLQRFWIMKRIPDVEGADYLVQLAAATLDELRARRERIEAFGIVQSKFIEGAHEVTIPITYIMDERGPRDDFFLLVHSDNENGEPELYFFTAEQINNEKDFYRRTNAKRKDEFVFARAAGRTYDAYHNVPRTQILDTIEQQIKSTEQNRNERFVAQVLEDTISPAMIYEEVVSRYVPDAGDEIRIPYEGSEYILRQEGEVIKVTKYSRLTNTTTVIGTFTGQLGKVGFDPLTETISAWPGV